MEVSFVFPSHHRFYKVGVFGENISFEDFQGSFLFGVSKFKGGDGYLQDFHY
jgi:hypothetical protein